MPKTAFLCLPGGGSWEAGLEDFFPEGEFAKEDSNNTAQEEEECSARRLNLRVGLRLTTKLERKAKSGEEFPTDATDNKLFESLTGKGVGDSAQRDH